MTIDHYGDVPIYEQLAAILREQIASGKLAPRRPIPSKKALTQEHGIAGGTVDRAVDLLKAYRDLEREGLVEPRAGHGTFVLRRPLGPPPGTHSRLARSLAQWVRGAREAGLDDESIESLLRVTLQAAAEEEIA